MEILVRSYTADDIDDMVCIWNQVVEDGVAFPQEEFLDHESGREFFDSQTYCGVAQGEDGHIYGLYILHPNNIGRCGHICNASYAVEKDSRGLHIGEKLVKDCLVKGKEYGFGVLQFNAVVENNIQAQAEQSCKNVGAILEAAGLGFENVIKTTCFLADMGDFAAFNEVYAKYFVSAPGRSCVAVKDLPKGALCEIEAIAVK